MNKISVFLLILFITNTSCSNPGERTVNPYNNYADSNVNVVAPPIPDNYDGSDRITIQGSGKTIYKDQYGNIHEYIRKPGSTTVITDDGVITKNENQQRKSTLQNGNSISINIRKHRYRCSDWIKALESNDTRFIEDIEIYINGYLDSIDNMKPIQLEKKITDACNTNINTPFIEVVKNIITTKDQLSKDNEDINKKEVGRAKNKDNYSANHNNDKNSANEINKIKNNNKNSANKSNKNTDNKFSCETKGIGSSCNKGNGQSVIINQ
jgi:hypothetical protein